MERLEKVGTRSGKKEGTKSELKSRKQLKITLCVEEQKGLSCLREVMKEGKLLEIRSAWPDCGSWLHYLSCKTGSR